MTARQPTFAEQVYAIVAQIPAGRVTTYGWIAKALGAPRAARQVGWAMHQNTREDLPCHRVINRQGELSGGWAWGEPTIMRQLLEAEGVQFDQHERVNLRRYGWHPEELDLEPIEEQSW